MGNQKSLPSNRTVYFPPYVKKGSGLVAALHKRINMECKCNIGQNAGKYVGRVGNKIVASGNSPEEVLEAVNAGNYGRPLIMFIPPLEK